MPTNQTEPYLSTYFHQKRNRLCLPIAGNFELTARCNFNCPMCYVHMSADEVEKKGRELTTEQWINLAEVARNKGMLFILITGGEPFVRKDFFEIYGAMKKMGLMVSINSNGSMLEGEILEKLLADPPFRINISLYGGCNETYQRMCGLPMYDKVLKNIITLKERGVDVRLNLSITPYNCDDIEKIYNIAVKHNIQVKASSYMYPPIRLEKEIEGYGNRLSPIDSARYSVEWDKLRFTEEEFKKRAENMKKLIEAETDRITVEDGKKKTISKDMVLDMNDCAAEMETDPKAGVTCRAGSTSFWMTWDGQMRPCGMMPGPTAYPLEVGFEEAWNTIREETKKIRQPAKCVNCSKKEVCGACAAVCVAETGAFDQVPEYMCERTENIIKMTWEKSV